MRKIWPWEDMEEIPMSNGVVMLVVSVPPGAMVEIHAGYPPPPSPVVKLESAAGGTETVRVLPDTPEWEEYVTKRQEYQKEMARRTGVFVLDYGCIGWIYPKGKGTGTGGGRPGKPIDIPPEEYEPPPMMKRWGVEMDMTDDTLKRVSFIRHVLIRTDADMEKLGVKLYAEGPPTRQEVKAAAVPFESSGQTEPQ